MSYRRIFAALAAATLVVMGLSVPAQASPGQTVNSFAYGAISQTDASSLVTALVPGQVGSVSGVIGDGAGWAMGTFAGFASAVGVDKGVVLSTGCAATQATCVGSIEGPFQDVNLDHDMQRPGDPDVAALVGDKTIDAAVLEFDVTTLAAGTLTVPFVFGSEDEGAPYKDGFVFMVNGVNHAKMGGQAVTLANLAGVSGLVNNSSGSKDTQMRYFTPVQTITATLTAGKNHIKIAIADGGQYADGTPVASNNSSAMMGPATFAPATTEVTPSALAPVQPVCQADWTLSEAKLPLPTTPGATYAISSGTVGAGNTVTVTATAQTGYTLKTGNGWTAAADGKKATSSVTFDNPKCEAPAPTQVTPAALTVVQPTCKDDGSRTEAKLTLPPNTGGVKYAITSGSAAPGAKVTVTATADSGYALKAGNDWKVATDGKSATQEVTFDDPQCQKPDPEPTKVTPAKLTPIQPKCENGKLTQAKLDLPTTTGVTYGVVEGTVGPGNTVKVRATAQDKFVLQAGNGWTLEADSHGTSATQEVTFDNPDCVKPPTKVKPAELKPPTQPICQADWTLSEAKLTMPTDTESIVYTKTGDVAPGSTVTVTATAQDGFVLEAAKGWTLSTDSKSATQKVTFDNPKCEKPGPTVVKPVGPKITQAKCLSNGEVSVPKVTLPTTKGIDYVLDGDVVQGSTVTVTATAKEGYVLGEAEGWTAVPESHSVQRQYVLDVVENCEPSTTEPTEKPEKPNKPKPNKPKPNKPAPNQPAPQQPGASDALAYTGSEIAGLTLAGVALLLLGAVGVVATRRRRTEH